MNVSNVIDKNIVKYKQPMRKLLIGLILLMQILALLFCVVKIIKISTDPFTYSFVLDNARNYYDEYVIYEEDTGWNVINEFEHDTNQEILDIRSAETISNGSYRIRFEYKCEEDQAIIINSTGESRSMQFTLDHEADILSLEYDHTSGSGSVAIWVKYSGNGKFSLNRIYLEETCDYYLRFLVVIIALSVFVNLVYIFRERIKLFSGYAWMMMGVVLLSSVPLFHYGIGLGHDLGFHLMRIEGLTQELKRGNFQAYILSDCIDGYGYPVSIYYSNLFLYFPAFLRLLGFGIVDAYKFFVVAVNIATGVIAYKCFSRLFKDNKISAIVTMCYMLAPYRLTDVYVRSAVGEYCSFMFYPVLALAVWKIYGDNCNDSGKKGWISIAHTSLVFAIGMTGLIESHILSTEVTLFFLVIIAVIYVRKTVKLQNMVTYLLAIIETILLNAAFIVPFINYYLNEPTKIKYIAGGSASIQSDGAYVSQLLSVFSGVTGLSQKHSMSGRLQLSVGLVLSVVLILGIILWVKKRCDKAMKVCICLGGLSLWMSTDLFPWDYLASKFGIFNMLAQIQYPWRMLGPAVVFLSILLGLIMSKNGMMEMSSEWGKKITVGIYAISLVMALFFISSYSDGIGSIIDSRDKTDLNMTSAIMGGEYLPHGSNIDLLDGTVNASKNGRVELISKEGTTVVVDCEELAGIDAGSIEVPLLNYHGYQAIDEDGNEFDISYGENNVIRFEIPAGYKGRITVQYVVRKLWVIAQWMTIISIVSMLATYVVLKRKVNCLMS